MIIDSSLEKLGRALGDDVSSLQVLGHLVAVSPLVLYTRELGVDYGATFVSAGVKTMWGYEPGEFLSQDRFWIDHIHPDDVQRVLSRMCAAR